MKKVVPLTTLTSSADKPAKGSWGGSRPGAGRKGGKRPGAGAHPKQKSTLIRSLREAEARAAENIAAQFQIELESGVVKYLKNLQTLASGLSKEEAAAFGELPDRYANIYLIDRYLGKPTERVEARQQVVVRVVYEDRPQVIEGEAREVE